MALLLLTGCSAATQENVSVNNGTSASAVQDEPAAPLVAETPDAPSATSENSPEGAYLAAIKEARAGKILTQKTQIPDATDAQLLSAGQAACVKIAAGEPSETISVIEGETRDAAGYFTDSSAITGAATKTLCP